MFEAKYFMGVDTGTQSVRVIVADVSGNIIAANEQAYNTYYPQPGWAEQKPDEWWDSFNKAVAAVTSELSMGVRHSIETISVCATSSTVVPVDERGEALTDAILWMDTRAVAEAEAINKTGHPILQYCGGEESVEWMIPKTLWLKNNKPEIYQRSHKIVEYLDWLNYKLCGKFVTSICQAACKWNYVASEGGWPDDFFRQIGLEDYEEKLVTDIARVGEVLGRIDHDFAEKYDLNPDMVVVEGGIDAHIGMLGMGVAKPGRMAMIMGTSFVQLAFAEGEIDEYTGIWGPYVEPIVPAKNLLEGGQISAGSIVKWFMKEFGLTAEDNPYAAMNEAIADIPPGAEGLVALDFFQGNRTPYKDPSASGVIYGLTLRHTKAHIYKALLEAVAFGSKNIIDNFENQGCPVDTIVGCGGVTKDPVFMQIISDVTGKPIIVTIEPSAGALGCAIVGAVGAGVYEDFDEATQSMVKDAYIVEPNLDNTKRYEAVFETYTEVYDSLKNVMHKR